MDVEVIQTAVQTTRTQRSHCHVDDRKHRATRYERCEEASLNCCHAPLKGQDRNERHEVLRNV